MRIEREPRRGPDVWLAQAHRCGLGYALEARAISRALQAPDRPAGAYLALNMSPSSLTSDEVLRALPSDLHGIVIEITENELASDDPALHAAVAELRDRGAQLAVDDTGAGYAGLTHVMRLRPDIIKLDRALTTGVDEDPTKAALIASFVRYARDIGATICAEGIETLSELERLADLDVAYGQGYVIARPAEPWPPVAPAAERSCLDTFRTSLAAGAHAPDRHEYDGLEALARRLAGVRTPEDLEHCLPAIARELRSDEVRITCDTPRTVHLLDDPDDVAALHAQGYRSALSLPLVHRGGAPASLRAYRRTERPWSRFEVSRARLISHQLAAALQRVGTPPLLAA
jgi:EAL domain-containing protein (putative c-di-GMP-specific phosphodiesterase class I)